jgi:hypothetical protein
MKGAGRDEVLRRDPAKKWDADLPATADYQQRTEKLPAPKDLKPGFYFILASHDSKFREVNNRVYAVPVWVSELALVIRPKTLLTA